MSACTQQPRPHSPTGDLGEIAGVNGQIVKGCVREVSLAQVSCILMYVYVPLPTPLGAWSMALGLQQRIYYFTIISTHSQRLNLDGLNFLTDIGTLAILETCPLLRHLDLDGEMLTDKTAVFIGRTLTSLEHLGISFCSHLTDSALMAISELHNLQSLRLRKGTNFTSEGFDSLFSRRDYS